MMTNASNLNLIRAFGFSSESIMDVPALLRALLAEGDVVACWDNGLKIYHRSQGNEANPVPSCVEIPELKELHEVLDFFAAGNVDALLLLEEKQYLHFSAQAALWLERLEHNKNEELNLEQVLKDNLQDAFLLNLIGKYLAMQGKVQEAASCFRQAIELNRDYGEPYANMGSLLWQHGQKRDGFVMSVEAMLKCPFNIASQLNFFDIGYELEEFETMINVIYQVLPVMPECIELKHHLALCHRRLGQSDQARAVLETIIEQYPEDDDAQKMLGEC